MVQTRIKVPKKARPIAQEISLLFASKSAESKKKRNNMSRSVSTAPEGKAHNAKNENLLASVSETGKNDVLELARSGRDSRTSRRPEIFPKTKGIHGREAFIFIFSLFWSQGCPSTSQWYPTNLTIVPAGERQQGKPK